VLTSSAADSFAREQGGDSVRVVSFDGATDAMTAVRNGQIDATLQDVPAALFYRERFPSLALAGPPVGHGYYVIFVRRGDQALRDAIDGALGRLIASGEIRRLYEKYGIWNDAQDELTGWTGARFRESGSPTPHGWRLLWHYRPLLLDAALMTIVLSVTSMPLAMLIGLFVALGRLYGPSALKVLLGAYVELLRGTPLMLQLFVLFYLLRLPPLVAGIGGLAINYSAYEAEIYRAGLQAIPAGQMEAALALGMSRRLALRRIIVPQAVRIVIPPVTNDFIALFKDTSVCSAITLVELTKQYSILGNSTGGWVEFAVATSFLYLAMSVPLSWFSRWSERWLGSEAWKGGAT
jgi:polar amino acid transport system substrate-binding protein